MEPHIVIEIAVTWACRFYALRKRWLFDNTEYRRDMTCQARATILHVMLNSGLFGSVSGCFAAFKMTGNDSTIQSHRKFMRSAEYRRRIEFIKSKILDHAKS